MKNDINKMPHIEKNIDDVGKYGKFIEFEWNDEKWDALYDFRFLEFTTDKLQCDIPSARDRWETSLRMCDNLEKKLITDVQPEIDILYQEFLDKKNEIIKVKLDSSIQYKKMNKAVLKCAKLMTAEESSNA